MYSKGNHRGLKGHREEDAEGKRMGLRGHGGPQEAYIQQKHITEFITSYEIYVFMFIFALCCYASNYAL